MADVLLKDVRKSFDDLEIIHGANLTINTGEFVVFVGPSGCGKSTLLRLIAGLETITSGELHIDDRLCNDIPPKERGVAMVFQSYALYPHMSVFDNMAFALKLAHVDKDETKRRVHEAADILQIQHLLERKPKALSGGQRQRVAIGRAIVREPKVFLFDEPLSNLDAALRVQMRIEIARLHKRLGTTIIYVTHDQVEAMTMATKIVVLNVGNIEQFGAPLELYNYPSNRFVAGFIGSPKMNFVEAKLDNAEKDNATVRLPSKANVRAAVDASEADKDASVTLGIRPEHIIVEPNGAHAERPMTKLDVEVALVEHLGEGTLVYAKMPEVSELLVCRTEGISRVKEGEQIQVGFPTDSCHLFRDDDASFKRAVDLDT